MATEQVNGDPSPHVELAESLIKYAGQFPWTSYKAGDDAEEGTWRVWNIGFVRAGAALLRCIVVLVQNGLGREAQLQQRALMELVANQYYMGKDKQRAVDFAAAQAVEQQRLVRIGRKYNILKDDDAYEIALRTAEERYAIGSYLGSGEDDDDDDIRPFGKSAKQRFKAADMDWQYDVIYEMASSLTHMNARALAVYAEGTSVEGGLGTLVLSNAMMLKVLYKADEALEQGQRGVIDGYMAEQMKRAGSRPP